MKLSAVLIALTIACASAHAAPPTAVERGYIAHMVGECSSVMGKNACRVLLDQTDCVAAVDKPACRLTAFRARYPHGLIVPKAGVFTADEYFQYVDAGDRMCDVIVRSCSADYAGRGCLMARALWRQQ